MGPTFIICRWEKIAIYCGAWDVSSLKVEMLERPLSSKMSNIRWASVYSQKSSSSRRKNPLQLKIGMPALMIMIGLSLTSAKCMNLFWGTRWKPSVDVYLSWFLRRTRNNRLRGKSRCSASWPPWGPWLDRRDQCSKNIVRCMCGEIISAYSWCGGGARTGVGVHGVVDLVALRSPLLARAGRTAISPRVAHVHVSGCILIVARPGMRPSRSV